MQSKDQKRKKAMAQSLSWLEKWKKDGTITQEEKERKIKVHNEMVENLKKKIEF